MCLANLGIIIFPLQSERSARQLPRLTPFLQKIVLDRVEYHYADCVVIQ